jgi:diacylglycerol kinase (ATP)
MKYLAILNPSAAKGAALKNKPKIEKLLEEYLPDHSLIVSAKPGDPAILARKAAEEDYDVVVAVGGDGTSNEIINGLMAAKMEGKKIPKLAVIPAGRGNDFAASMGIPVKFEDAVKAIAAGTTRSIDVGQVFGGDYPGGKFFGNGLGIGFDTIVGFEAAKLPAFLSGIPGYLIAAIKTIFLYFKAPTLKVRLDDETFEQQCLIISVMNGWRMGTSFKMTPLSKPDDGLFSLMIVGQVSRIGVIKLMGRIMAGTQEGHPFVRMPLTGSIEITALKGSLPVHADGETICEKGDYLRAEILKNQIDLIIGG